MAEISSIQGFSSSKPLEKGLVQVFTGEGKGKTSAALGGVLRALGNGLRVCIITFMKKGRPSGEWEVLSKMPDVRIARFGSGAFVKPGNVNPEAVEQAEQALTLAREAAFSGNYDLIMLDEINVAAAWELIELDDVLRLIQDKPVNVELILTGRQADARLIELADLVTECAKIKHPYDKGIKARRGIEF